MNEKFLSHVLLFLSFIAFSPFTKAEDTQPTPTRDEKTDAPITSQVEEPKNNDNESRGGLFVEPFLTYAQSDVTLSYPAPLSDSDESADGFGIGARLGFHVHQIVFVALDGRYSQPEYESGALGGDSSSKAYNLGATLGMQTPFAGIRVWGTYIFTGALDPDEIEGFDAKFSEKNGYRVGAGIYIAMISVNLEYSKADYDKTELQSVGPFTPGDVDSINASEESFILSVSFPIAI